MAAFQQVGEQFCQQYYQIFDTNRAGLAPLYGEQSMLTFEGEQFQGAAAIAQKLASLPFQKVRHQIVKQPDGGRQPEPAQVRSGLLLKERAHRELLLPERFVPPQPRLMRPQ
mmetsp:Transcript_51391/g.165040  ORF Transcript_51391/g.165040 Transcript_51391/m.165040 type:complete len:112 (+) Transcript_51391:82-417(+)